MPIHIIAELIVPEENVGTFVEAAKTMTGNVREKEAGSTLSYDYFTTAGAPTRCIAHEVYRDAPAFLKHLTTFEREIADFVALFRVERLTVIGDIPGDLAASLQDIAQGRFHHFSETICVL